MTVLIGLILYLFTKHQSCSIGLHATKIRNKSDLTMIYEIFIQICYEIDSLGQKFA